MPRTCCSDPDEFDVKKDSTDPCTTTQPSVNDSMPMACCPHRSDEFDAFVEITWSELHRIARRIVNDHYQAEVVVQDVLTSYVRRRTKSPLIKNARAYLITMTVNAARKMVKNVDRARDKSTASVPESPDHQCNDPLDTLIREEQNSVLFEAIDRLGPDVGEIVCLYEFGDLSFDDIATLLAQTKGAVRGQYYRALKKLHRILSNPNPSQFGTKPTFRNKEVS